MQKYYEDWVKGNTERIAEKVLDPEGILTGNGYGLEGVYEFEYVDVKNGLIFTAYIGQAGVVKNAPAYMAQDIYERCCQHLKRMLGNKKYFTYWTGLKEDSNWKIRIHLLQTESDHKKRLELEEQFIAEKRPLLQDTVDGMFKLYPTKYGYSRNDLCIHCWNGQRHEAFLHRVKSLKKAV